MYIIFENGNMKYYVTNRVAANRLALIEGITYEAVPHKSNYDTREEDK